MKKIYVSDSFNTRKIADILQQLFSSTAVVVCELNFEPVDDLIGSVLKASTDASQHYENKVEIGNIDVFFLSARAVLEGQINIQNLKKTYGNANAKVVVMSVMHDYLDDVKKGNYGADFFHYKDTLISVADASRLAEEEKSLLLSYLD